MSAATFSTSSKRSCSYRLLVKPSPVRAMPDNASLHRSKSWAETIWGASSGAIGRTLIARKRGQHGPLHLLASTDVDVLAARVGHVEGVDHFGAEGGDLGVADVEAEVGQRPCDPVQHGDAVGCTNLDERGARRHAVVDEHTR